MTITTTLRLMYEIAQNNKSGIVVIMVHLIILLQKMRVIILLMLVALSIRILLVGEF